MEATNLKLNGTQQISMEKPINLVLTVMFIAHGILPEDIQFSLLDVRVHLSLHQRFFVPFLRLNIASENNKFHHII